MRAGTWNSFDKKFEPLTKDDGSLLRDFHEVKDCQLEKVWTVIEADNGKMYCATGFHIVNRIGYLLCAQPWADADQMRDYVY